MKVDKTLDCFGLLCPMPIIKTAQAIKEMKTGEVLEVLATDDGIKPDIAAWISRTGHELLKIDEEPGDPPVFKVYVKKK